MQKGHRFICGFIGGGDPCLNFYGPQTKFAKGYVFTGVCLSTRGGRV